MSQRNVSSHFCISIASSSSWEKKKGCPKLLAESPRSPDSDYLPRHPITKNSPNYFPWRRGNWPSIEIYLGGSPPLTTTVTFKSSSGWVIVQVVTCQHIQGLELLQSFSLSVHLQLPLCLYANSHTGTLKEFEISRFLFFSIRSLESFFHIPRSNPAEYYWWGRECFHLIWRPAGHVILGLERLHVILYVLGNSVRIP